MRASTNATSAGLNTNQINIGVVNKRMKNTHRIGATAYTGDDHIG